MKRDELAHWEIGLRRAANSGGSSPTPRAGDRTSALPFLLWKGLDAVEHFARPESVDPDAALWWALRAHDHASAEGVLVVDSGVRGALFAQDAYTTIEVWTEAELSGLQALWWLGREPTGAPLRARLRRAAAWHLEYTQPDNATNRPWGIPAFLDLALADHNPEARLYAETLLHNAHAANGAVEPFSAIILRDAADALALMVRE